MRLKTAYSLEIQVYFAAKCSTTKTVVGP